LGKEAECHTQKKEPIVSQRDRLFDLGEKGLHFYCGRIRRRVNTAPMLSIDALFKVTGARGCPLDSPHWNPYFSIGEFIYQS